MQKCYRTCPLQVRERSLFIGSHHLISDSASSIALRGITWLAGANKESKQPRPIRGARVGKTSHKKERAVSKKIKKRVSKRCAIVTNCCNRRTAATMSPPEVFPVAPRLQHFTEPIRSIWRPSNELCKRYQRFTRDTTTCHVLLDS